MNMVNENVENDVVVNGADEINGDENDEKDGDKFGGEKDK